MHFLLNVPETECERGLTLKGVDIILSQKWTFMSITGIQVLSELVDFLKKSFRVLNTITCMNTPNPVFSVLHPILIFLGIVITSPGPGNPVLGIVGPETFYVDVICDRVLCRLEVGESQDDVYMRYICCKFWCDLKPASVLQRRSHCMGRWEGMVGDVSYSTSLERSSHASCRAGHIILGILLTILDITYYVKRMKISAKLWPVTHEMESNNWLSTD